MLTIAQITDLHITTPKDGSAPNLSTVRLLQVLHSIHQLQPRPTAIIATGDLVDNAEFAEYLELRALLATSELPIFFGLGNHDARAPFLQVFSGGSAPTDEHGFVQYAIDFEGLRVLMCDTLDEGGDKGAFCQERASWLARTLDQAPDRPTLVAMHHPPVASGVRWMDPEPGAEWIGRLETVLRGRTQVQGLVCGHLHRAFTTRFAGHPLIAGPAAWIQLSLNLSPVDMRVADGREILVQEPPGFLLHMWGEGRLTTHIAVAGEFSPAVTYSHPFLTT